MTITDGYSLEVSAKDIPALTAAASRIIPASTISIPYLAREDDEVRLVAVRAVRQLGFTPMPHLSARRIASHAGLQSFVERTVADAGVDRCFVIAGDSSVPVGPFPDSASLIETGIFERMGMKVVGVAGHPEGHPVMRITEQWEVLARKCDSIVQRGMTPVIITQFVFDANIVLAWLEELRGRGIRHPVHVGVPGPASIATLTRYAALCGVRASASMLSRYGISIGKLFGPAGPDRFVDQLASGLTEAHGNISLHFFPFGGIAKLTGWLERYSCRNS